MVTGVVNAVGVWFYSISTDCYLYLLRNDPKYPDTWGLPGGKVDEGENFLDALQRECIEELGYMPEYIKLVPLEKFTSTDSGFVYGTFWCCTANEFIPILNHEHVGYAWIKSGQWPRPMHPGLWNTVNIDCVQDKLRLLQSIKD
jgi:8-oxo-dGTP pyrophosphatase MutT (NUDIX family)